MAPAVSKGLLISDFNADNLAAFVSSDQQAPRIELEAAPFGQVYQLLVDHNAAFWKPDLDFAVVWTRPDGVIPAFRAALEYQPVDLDTLLGEVDDYATQLLSIQERVKFAFIPSWVLPSYRRGYGLLDMREGLGLSNLLARMNLRLSERLAGATNFYLLDTQRWAVSAGKQAYNPKLWYMGKIAFSSEVIKAAGRDIKAAVSALKGGARKLIVLDLDDTLWGGIVGDEGWENLTLGGHSLIGEAFVDFQKALKALTRRGIVLGIASKNDEAVALEAINKHPEMVLKENDFAGWKINWNDKAQNIADLVAGLNLGLQSVVFIDDNPVERARVREMLPEVLVPEWPEDKTQYASALLSLDCFDTPAVSAEDAKRTEMYVVERQRSSLKQTVGSVDEWLASLGIQVQLEALNETNLPRAAQLFNKTNQMNLSTRRMTAEELLEWSQQPGNSLWTVRVADKFGDYGLTGIVSLVVEGEQARIADFLLSCRVMGRKVEETMVAHAVQQAQAAGAAIVRAEYLPTPKNRPCLDFWQRSGFDCSQNDHTFTWHADQQFPFPEQVQVQV
jgi:FkbH-like protein